MVEVPDEGIAAARGVDPGLNPHGVAETVRAKASGPVGRMEAAAATGRDRVTATAAAMATGIGTVRGPEIATADVDGLNPDGLRRGGLIEQADGMTDPAGTVPMASVAMPHQVVVSIAISPRANGIVVVRPGRRWAPLIDVAHPRNAGHPGPDNGRMRPDPLKHRRPHRHRMI